MVLQDYKIDGDSITISKAELEKWRDHYHNEALEEGKGKIGWFYLGKREVMIDILKHFEPLIELLKAIEDMPMDAQIWLNHPDLGLTALEEVKVSYKYNQVELY